MANPPLGYQNLLKSESLEDIYTTDNVVDKSISLCKSAIHEYLESCLSPTGTHRSYITASVSPEGLQYVTDLTFDDEMKSDPNLRKTYLARFFAENTGRLPSVLIIDQGVESVDVGLTSVVEGMSFKNRWRGEALFIGKVSLSVSVATYSEEETTTLSQLLLYILDTLSDVISNKLLYKRGQKWEVRLPISGYASGGLTNITLEGDNKTQVWMRTIDFTAEIECHTLMAVPVPEMMSPATTFIGLRGGDPQPVVLNLTPNQSIKLGSPYQLFIQNMRIGHVLGVSDPNIALVTPELPWLLQPRRVGSALLYIFDVNRSPKQDPETGTKKDLILDIPFKVTV